MAKIGTEELRDFVTKEFGTPVDYHYVMAFKDANNIVQLDDNVMVKVSKHLVFKDSSVYSVHYAVLHNMKIVVIDSTVTKGEAND